MAEPKMVRPEYEDEDRREWPDVNHCPYCGTDITEVAEDDFDCPEWDCAFATLVCPTCDKILTRYYAMVPMALMEYIEQDDSTEIEDRFKLRGE